MRNVLILVGNLEREKADVAPGLGHEVASQVIQKIRLAAVGLPGNDYQSALIGGMKHLVGQRAIAHIVSMIVFATQHVQHLIRPFAYGDDVRRMPRTCRSIISRTTPEPYATSTSDMSLQPPGKVVNRQRDPK